MSWFSIVKNDIADNLSQQFNAKAKLMGNTWSLLFNDKASYYKAFDYFTNLTEDNEKFTFGYGIDKKNNWYRITFGNKELKGMD